MISKENGERIITPVGEPITFDANTILRNATMLRLEHQNMIEDSTSDLEYKPTPIIQRGMTMNLSKKIMENDALFAEASAQLFDGGVLDGNPVQVESPEQQTEPSQQRDIIEEPAR